MAIRDVVLLLIIVGSLPFCFARPWIGILMWSWIGYMNPHRYAWDVVKYALPPALLVGIPTLAGLVLTKERKPFIWCRETILVIVLWCWFTVTTVCSLYPDDAWPEWIRVSKVILMLLVTVPLFQDRKKLRWLLLVIAVSFGFYGFKGGLFVIGTGGQYTVEGAPGRSSVSANNSIALALNMCLPIFLYLAKEEPRRWLRLGLYATFFLSMAAVPFTYSRGGVLGLAVVLAVLFTGSRGKLLLVPVAVLALGALALFAPDKWVERMQTIQHYQEDASANSRLISWGVGIRLAHDHPIVGGGFQAYNKQTFLKYAPDYPYFHDAHSIYFNLLGEQGYTGLILFLILVACAFATLRRLRRVGGQVKEMQWIANYAHMLQASIWGYLITGAFLSVAYFDFGYHLFVMVAILRQLAVEELKATPASKLPTRSSFALPSQSRWNFPSEAAAAARSLRGAVALPRKVDVDFR